MRFIQGEQRLYKLRRVGGVLLRVKVHWLRLEALGMLCLYTETFQVLAGQVLIGRKGVEPVNLPRTG